MSLKDCLKQHKLDKHEKAILRGMVDDMTEKDMEENAAAVAAVKARIADVDASIATVKAQIAEAGGEIPQPASRTPDGFEASGPGKDEIGTTTYEQIGEFKIGDKVRARGKEVGEIRRMFVVDGRSRAEVLWPSSEEYPDGSSQNVDVKSLKLDGEQASLNASVSAARSAALSDTLPEQLPSMHEEFLYRLPDAMLDAFAASMGVRRGKRDKAGLVSAIAGNARADIQAAWAKFRANAGEPVLSSYSQADLEQRDADAAAGEKRRQDEDKAAARKAQADRERDNFTLTGSDRAADANPDQEALFSRTQDDVAFAQEVLNELAAEDALFRYPLSKKSTLEGVFQDVLPDHEYAGDATREDEKKESGADRRDMFKTQEGTPYYVFQKGRDAWIDVSRLQEGERGGGIYAAVLNYTHNAGKRLVGDPAGLSEAAVVRRTWAMLSSALRFGTTKHMEAAAEQQAGNPDKGIKPLAWQGDDVEKTRGMIDTALSTLEAQNPDVSKFRFDFARRQFVDANGKSVGRGRFVAGAKRGGARASRSGQATLRSGILIRSLVSSESGQRSGILEQVLRGASALAKGPLEGTFKRGATQGGVDKADLEQALAPVIAGWANGPKAVNVVQSYSGLPKHLYELGVAEGAIGPGASLHAVFDNTNKSVYLIADQIESIEAGQFALLHETMGHFGLRGILGREHYTSTMRRVYVANAQIRAQAQQQMKDFGYPQDLATEEALADLAASGETFSGFKQIMAAIQRWLRDHGMGKLADWFESHTGAESAREHAKTGILHLLGQARAFVEKGDRPHFYTPQMAAAFSRSAAPMRRFGFPAKADPPIATFSGETRPMKAHPDYVAAKAGDVEAAVRAVSDLVTDENIDQARKRFGDGVVYIAVHGEEATGKNALPIALASYYAAKAGGSTETEIVQSNKPHHTGAKPMERLISPVQFDGPVTPGARYVLVDDVATLGGTFASLADHIQRGGGEVIGSVVLVNAGRIDTMAADPKLTAALERRYGDEIRELFGVEPAALTASEAQYLIGFRSADELRARAVAAKQERRGRLLSKGISEEEINDGARFSRSITAGPALVDPTDNAARLLPRAYKAWAHKTSERFANALDLFGDLEGKNDLLTIRNLAKGKIGTADELVKEIKKAFDHGSPDDAKAAYAFFTNAGADPSTITNQAVREAAVNAKDTINHIGDQLVEAGLITEEARAAHDDAYLPQLYLQFLADTGAYKNIGGGKRPSDFGYTKGRKIEKVIGPDGEPQLFWKGRDGGDMTPLTREEVLALGPINDPGFLASMAIARPMRDMALLEYMEQIANDERWVLPGSVVEWNGKTVSAMWLKGRADLMRRNADHYDQADADEARAIAAQMDRVAEEGLGKQVATKDYAQIPNSARWGMLRGMWVRREIVDDLQGLAGMHEAPTNFFSDWFGYGGKGTRLTQFWKSMKVALNLPGQIRNYISNNITMFMSGVPAYRLPDLNFRAWHEFLSKGELYQQAKATGIFHGTFANQELSRFKRDLVDLEARTQGWHPMRRIVALAEKLQDFGGDIYGAVEGVMKLAVIMDRMGRLNMPIEQAALEADKWLIDYSNVPNAIRQMRGAPIGMPFITYPYKMLPLIVETALERPHKLIALYALGKALTLAAAAMLHVEPDDIDKLKLALPQWLQKNGATLFLPWKDEQGRWRFFDASYFLPWTYFTNLAKGAGGIAKDVVEGGSGVGKVPELMGDIGFGGPIPSALIALQSNVDPFTKREITTKGAPANVQLLELMNYTYDLLAPPMFTSNGFVSPMGLADPKFGGKLTQAMTGQTNKFGDPRATTTQAFSSLFGMNVYPVDPERSRAQNMKQMAREIDDVETAAKKALADRSLTPEQKREVAKEYAGERTRRSRLLRDYADRSKVPERLK